MANRNQPIKAASSKRASKKPRSVPHLKPLSIYTHKVFCKATNSSSPSWSPDCPSWNWKVELSNIRTSVGQKRRLDVSSLDETDETAAKKPCLVSSDSGCVLDSFDTFQDVNPVSLHSSSVVYDEIKRGEKSLTDQKSLDLGWVDGSDKINVHSSSPVQSEDSANRFAFVYDVEDIMCLSPIDRADIGIGGLENFSQVESKITKSEEVHYMKPYNVTVPKLSHDKTQPVSPPIMSTPLNKSKELVKRPPRLNHRLDLDKENWSVVCPQPEKAAASGGQTNFFIDVPRPVVLYREEDWEKAKNAYVESVKRHMTDDVQNGVMSELLHLMDTVANRERGINGRKWQHPSDLTTRNYRSRTDGHFFSLGEWVNLNCPNYRRFKNRYSSEA